MVTMILSLQQYLATADVNVLTFFFFVALLTCLLPWKSVTIRYEALKRAMPD